MMIKKIKILALVIFFTGITMSYQNCARVQPGLTVKDSQLMKSEGTQAVIQNGDGDVESVVTVDPPVEDVSVIVDPPLVVEDPMYPIDDPIIDDPIVVIDDPNTEVVEENENVDCVALAEKYKAEKTRSVIDIANLDKTGSITLMKENNFIYSSDSAAVDYNEINIVDSGLHTGFDKSKHSGYGKAKKKSHTVVCGINVEHISGNKNEAQLVRSTCSK